MQGYHDPIERRRYLYSFSLDAIEEYFAQLNPIAKRIACDINDTKANYGNLWNSLDYHEQNDIINDTLIKPEISLRYFDNFLTPTNSHGNSYRSSTDSLAAIVLKDIDLNRTNAADRDYVPKKKNSLETYSEKCNPYSIKNFYSFDGRNLNTFGMQKVALKAIQDDILGCFRDEHSRPFCYRTRSQINLFVLDPKEPMAAKNKIISNKIVAANLKTLSSKSNEDEESKKALDNYNRSQHQVVTNVKEKKYFSQNSSLSYTSVNSSNTTANRNILKSPENSYAFESKDKTQSISKNTKTSMVQNYLNSTQITPKIGVSYVIFSNSFSAEESSNLLQNCCQNDMTTGSCSSAATSDDDEKTLEDVHLLDNDSTIRKGFDFLNNW